MFSKSFKKIICFFLIFSYIWFFIDLPLSSYALTNYDALALNSIKLKTKDTLPFSTKTHIIVETDTIAKLCKRYNISILGFKKLNQGRLNFRKKLMIGSMVIVPSKPISNEMSKYLDGTKTTINKASNYATKAADLLNNNSDNSSRKQAVKRELFNEATSVVSSKITNYLGQYGTIELNLAANDEFSFKNSQFAMLLPLYDKGRYLVFTQMSYHMADGNRSIGNFGVGTRYFADHYMVGGNAFLDYDFSRHLKRLGLGAEYARNYFKVSVNGYLGQEDWRRNILSNFQERPANGWDVRLQGYLPQKPQFGAKVVFEQYYGKQVALFGKDNLQKNPYALTAGVDYTPVPLLNFNVDYKRGKDKQQETRLGFNVNYRLGMKLADQVNPENVAKLRSLQGSRYDLVDRNNDMVLEYKNNGIFTLSAPHQLSIRALSPFNALSAVQSENDEAKYHINPIHNKLDFSFFIDSTVNFDDSLTCDLKVNSAYGLAGGEAHLLSKDIEGKHAVYNAELLPPNEKALDTIPGPFLLSIIAADSGGRSAVGTINIEVHKNPHPNIKLLVNPISVAVGVLNSNDSENPTPAQIVLKVEPNKDIPKPKDICFAVKKSGEKLSNKYCEPEAAKGITVLQHPSPTGNNYVTALFVNSKALEAKEKTALYNIVPVLDGKPYEDEAQDLTVIRVDNNRPNVDNSALTLTPNHIANDNKEQMTATYKASNMGNGAIVKIAKLLKFVVEDEFGNIIPDSSVHKLDEIKDNLDGSYTAHFVGAKTGEYKLVVYYDTTIVASGKFTIIDANTLKNTHFTLVPPTVFVHSEAQPDVKDTAEASLHFDTPPKLGALVNSLNIKAEPSDNSLIISEFKYNRGGYKASVQGKKVGTYKLSLYLGDSKIANLETRTLTVKESNKIDWDKGNSKLSVTPGLLNVNEFASGTKKAKLILKLAMLSGKIDTKKLKFSILNDDAKDIAIAPIVAEQNNSYSAELTAANKNLKSAIYNFGVSYDDQIMPKLQAKLQLVEDKQIPIVDKSSFELVPEEVIAGMNAPGKLKLIIDGDKTLIGKASDISFDIIDSNGVQVNNIFARPEISEQNGVYQVNFKTTKAGTYIIKVKYKNSYLGDHLSATLKVKADDRDPKTFKSSLVTSPSTIIDSGQQTSDLILTLTDSYGNKLDNKSNLLSVANGNNKIDNLNKVWIKHSFIQKDPGVYVATLTGIGFASEIDLSAFYNKAKIGDGVKAHLSLIDPDDAPYAANCYFNVSADKILVNSQSAKIRFTAVNMYGYPLLNLDNNLKFVALDNNGAVLGSNICNISKIKNDKNGVYEAIITGKVEKEVTLKPLYKNQQVGSCQASLTIYVDDNISPQDSPLTIRHPKIKGDNKDHATITYTARTKLGRDVTNLKNLVFRSHKKTAAFALGDSEAITLNDYMDSPVETKPGTYEVKVKGVAIGTYDIWVEQEGTEVAKNHVELTILPDSSVKPDKNASFEIKGSNLKNKQYINANGKDPAKVTVKLTHNGKPMSGYARFLTLSVDHEDGIDIHKEFEEDTSDPGTYITKIYATKAGKYTFHLLYGGNPLEGTKEAILYATAKNNPVSGEKSEITSPEAITEMGVTPGILKLTLKDENGNLKGEVEPKTIKFSGFTNELTINKTPKIDADAATYSYEVLGHKKGKYTISVQVGDIEVKQTATVEVLSDLPFVPSKLSNAPKGDTGTDVDVTLDPVIAENNRPITDDISKYITLREDKKSFPFEKSGAKYIAHYNSDKIGDHTLTLYYQTPLTKEDINTNITTKIHLDSNKPASDKHSNVEGVKDPITENGQTHKPLIITLCDEDGNIISPDPSVIKLVFKNTKTGKEVHDIVLFDPPQVDKAKGTYTYEIKAKQAGTYEITVTVGKVELTNHKGHVTVLSDMPSEKSSLTPEKPTIDTDKDDKLTLNVVDKQGKAIADDISKFITLKDNKDSTLTSLSKEGNNYTASFKSIIAGEHTLTLFYKPLIGDEVDTKVTATITVTADNNPVDPGKSSVSKIEDITENGITNSTFTLTLRDANTNLLGKIPADKITLKPDGPEGALIINTSPKIDAKLATYTYTITSKKAATYNISIKIGDVDFKAKHGTVKVLSDMPNKDSVLKPETPTIKVDTNGIITLSAPKRDDGSDIKDDISSLIFLTDDKEPGKKYNFTQKGADYQVTNYKPSIAGTHSLSLYYVQPFDKKEVDTSVKTTVEIVVDSSAVDPKKSIVGEIKDITENGITSNNFILTLRDGHKNPIGTVNPSEIILTPNGVKDGVVINQPPTVDKEKGTYTYKITGKKAADYDINIQVGKLTFEKKATVKVLSEKPVKPSELEPVTPTVRPGEPAKLVLKNIVREGGTKITDDISASIGLREDKGTNVLPLSRNGDTYTAEYSNEKVGTYKLHLCYKAPLDKEFVDTDIISTITVSTKDSDIDPKASSVVGVTGKVTTNGLNKGTLVVTLREKHRNPLQTIDPDNILFDIAPDDKNVTIKLKDNGADKEKGVYTFEVSGTVEQEYTIHTKVKDKGKVIEFGEKDIAKLSVISSRPSKGSVLKPAKTEIDTGEEVNIELIAKDKTGDVISDDISSLISLQDKDDQNKSFDFRFEKGRLLSTFSSISAKNHTLTLWYKENAKAEAKETDISTTITVTANHNLPDPDKSRLVFKYERKDADKLLPNKQDKGNLVLKLVDKNGNEINDVAQAQINFKIPNLDDDNHKGIISKKAVIISHTKDAPGGIYNYDVTASYGGSYTVTAIAEGIKIKQTATVSAEYGTIKKGESSFKTNTANISVGDEAKFTLYAANADGQEISFDVSDKCSLWCQKDGGELKKIEDAKFTYNFYKPYDISYTPKEPGTYVYTLKFKRPYDDQDIDASDDHPKITVNAK